MAHASPTGKMTLWQRIKTFEPARVRAILAALVIIAGTIGLEILPYTERLDTAWTAFFAIIPLLQGESTRAAVTPTAAVVEEVNSNGEVVAGPASPQPTGQILRHIDDPVM